MVFVFDLDDTICDTDGYSDSYIGEFFVKYKFPYRKVRREARYAEQKYNWDEETSINWYKEFGDEMMEEFPAFEGAVEMINALYDAGHRIVISTARSTNWHTDPEGVTKRWLKKVGIKYDKLYFGRSDKERICEIEGADVFVDDDIDTTRKVAAHFANNPYFKVFLASTGYNKTKLTPEGVIRIRRLADMNRYLGLNNLNY